MSIKELSLDEKTRKRLNERYRTIDGRMMRYLLGAGLTWLRTNQEVVNALNVFPVPDGDTGTNMVLTMQAAWDEIDNLAERSIGKIAHAIAHGALMGARGNSGVILSQLWRGFARAIDEHESMDAELLVKALEEARETAYRGVVRPVEGTILTVSSDAAKGGKKAFSNGATSALEILEFVVTAADDSVQRTPELLPILKEAGVVDSGGLGLYYIFEGMLRAAYRQPLDKALAQMQPLSAINLEHAAESIEPGQDWEVVIDFRPEGQLDLQSYYDKLESIGTSIQVGEGDGIYRMHIHVADEKEYEPIEYTRTLGTITNIAIENLMIQVEDQQEYGEMHQLRLPTVNPDDIAVVTVSPGFGLARVFASLGAGAIVEGGQTMNPSTQEILDAIENLPTDKVIILPNNKNIIMCATQAAEITVKDSHVIPSKTIPQGISAMLYLEPEGDLDKVLENMEAALQDVQSGELTVATRSVEIDGVAVEEGQVIGLLNGKLAVAGNDIAESMLELLELSDANQAELITLYYGEDLSVMLANKISDMVRERWSHLEVELVEGGQPHYQLIFSVE
jgi:DAK2 domain fusion protein YloV